MTPEEWDKTLDINLRGMFLCTQRAAREMIEQRSGGTIVNLSSVHGFGAVPRHAHYASSKGGINMFTKASAIELAPHGIQVNAIAPGAIEVERYFAMPGYDREEWGQRIPAGRVGIPDDIGPLAAFLCTTGASYITGQIIWVDGGMISRLGGLRA
jgi:glucose 1-dehydrogenase/3-oxoacyl-[acyl-carrier protein] reductase